MIFLKNAICIRGGLTVQYPLKFSFSKMLILKFRYITCYNNKILEVLNLSLCSSSFMKFLLIS